MHSAWRQCCWKNPSVLKTGAGIAVNPVAPNNQFTTKYSVFLEFFSSVPQLHGKTRYLLCENLFASYESHGL